MLALVVKLVIAHVSVYLLPLISRQYEVSYLCILFIVSICIYTF